MFWKNRCAQANWSLAFAWTLIGFTLQKDGRSQGEGQGPPTKSPREQRVCLDKTGGTSRRLYLPNTRENQGQVLNSQCTYPRGRSIHGYGDRLAIELYLVCILYIAVTRPSDLMRTRLVVHQRTSGGLLPEGVAIGTDYRCLYLVSVSCLEFGSNVLCSPSSVLLTASLAPIMGLSTAIGTARTTARTGPWKQMSPPSLAVIATGTRAYLVARFVNLHRNS